MAQSALSRHISQLETLVGCRLFHRTGRGVTLTEIGQTALPRAKLMLQAAGQLVDDMLAQRGQPSGSVTLGLLPALSRPLVSRILKRTQASYPDIRLKAVEAYSGEVESMLADGRIDIGIFNRYRPRQREAREAVFSAPLYLVGKPGSPALARSELRFNAIGGLPLVLPAWPNGMRSYFDEICNRRNLKLNIALEVTSGTLIRDVLLNCDVYSVLPYHAIADEVRAGQLVIARIKDPDIRQMAFVETTCRHPLSNASRVVLAIVMDELRALGISSGPHKSPRARSKSAPSPSS
jgi:DNA-binding transcriptional LysR family regulator